MKLTLLAVGTRLPAWAETACTEYARRFPPDLPLTIVEVKTEPRTGGKSVSELKRREAERLRAQIPTGARLVALDERGVDLNTKQLADRLQSWRHDGRDVALLIGGPDGLDPTLLQSADETVRLSSLTLPHALARVVLIEALYRAWSLTTGHPYHRE
ncbi:23S rRNA (pseudouridine(1915)-N(3))-methyltransferase RlmH [Tepidiphilus olei]|uniref:23S rRNA (pseudouridine(1915)-N(3))-methyltransferase RlmH n=1 Tax=Tepidiphilus olei TaxID=2502184 RepID=UPI00115C5629|nr:23S rRNA (pseudouridine(1915)-N(3))-methyltransferase RlmH [Tepidiphilus olei]